MSLAQTARTFFGDLLSSRSSTNVMRLLKPSARNSAMMSRPPCSAINPVTRSWNQSWRKRLRTVGTVTPNASATSFDVTLPAANINAAARCHGFSVTMTKSGCLLPCSRADETADSAVSADAGRVPLPAGRFKGCKSNGVWNHRVEQPAGFVRKGRFRQPLRDLPNLSFCSHLGGRLLRWPTIIAAAQARKLQPSRLLPYSADSYRA
jgi:hypothetical protein